MLSRTLLRRQAIRTSYVLPGQNRGSIQLACRWPVKGTAFKHHHWRDIGWNFSSRSTRCLSTAVFSTILIPPAVFLGLVLTLWTWKCIMMVLFQDKIIYMPSIPPFSRQELLENYTQACKPVAWKEESIRSSDGTKLALCIGSIQPRGTNVAAPGSKLVLLYFQGNASSIPPRLPMLSSILKNLDATSGAPSCAVVALSYRGFWKSAGRASQAGIEKDATAALHKAFELARESNAKIVLWGQSIGANIAIDALMRDYQHRISGSPAIAGVLLETPFTSIRSMLAILYPQDWLPYKYLWPFLWNRWDNQAALKILAGSKDVPRFRIIAAGQDEVVPTIHSSQLADECAALGIRCDKVVVADALHHETTTKPAGRQAIVSFIEQCAQPIDRS